jgi:hypothetical protein
LHLQYGATCQQFCDISNGNKCLLPISLAFAVGRIVLAILLYQPWKCRFVAGIACVCNMAPRSVGDFAISAMEMQVCCRYRLRLQYGA